MPTLVSPGVDVSIIDQSQYLPAALGTVPFILLATAANKADPTSTAVAPGTTSANANQLYAITSQVDLVQTYGNPFFYTTNTGTPINGYELNEYGLLAAYSALGVTNLVYCLRADIDLASLVGQTGRPSGNPANGTYWLNTTSSTWGMYSFSSTTGQFTAISPIVISSTSQLTGGGYPIQSLGQVGSYAVNSIPNYTYPTAGSNPQFFYKNASNTWVVIGSSQWLNSVPTVQGTQSNPTLTAGNTLTISINGGASITVTVSSTPGQNTVAYLAAAINSYNTSGLPYITATATGGALNLFSAQTGKTPADTNPLYITISGTGSILTALGITAGTYYQPRLSHGTSSQQPLWQAGQTYPAPTGSIWIKIGSAGNGFNPVISQWNSTTSAWASESVVLAVSDSSAIAQIDSTGGQAIPAGALYAQYHYDNDFTVNSSQGYGKGPIYYWERLATGPTVITGTVVSPTFTTGPYTSQVWVTIPGSSTMAGPYTVTLANSTAATDFVTAWSAAGIPYTTVAITSANTLQLTHTAGGSIIVNDYSTSSTYQSTYLMAEAGFVIGTTTGVKVGPFATTGSMSPTQTHTSGVGSGLSIYVANDYQNYNVNPTAFANAGSGYTIGDKVTFPGIQMGGIGTGGSVPSGNDLIVEVISVSAGGVVTSVAYYSGVGSPNYMTQLSNWVDFTLTPSAGAPVAAPANLTNWYYSTVSQVDIMVNTATGWKGYGNLAYSSTGFPLPSGVNVTDPNGPLISPTAPTTQYAGTPLQYGDIWIDTSDLINYPVINRWQSVSGVAQWVLIDNTDSINSSGVIFADARWAPNGSTSPITAPIPTIQSMLTSNYLDLDAPSSSLYPVGILLFNTRLSGYNVKQYNANYFNNTNFPGASLPSETDAWVSASGLQENGEPYMGSAAQRIMVVNAMNAALNTNQAINDVDNGFNLIAAPNYPELQPGMISLNDNLNNTAFIVGDTPMTLPATATVIQNWATNANNASVTGVDGLVTVNTYMGLFYPSGLTTDLSGNLVAVPPSHMMIRTILRSDAASYPWFAPAGTNRGIIDNATSIGYIDATTGDFISIKTNQGLRDMLYTHNINPLVYFTGNGLLNYGNKVSFESDSALDRINVVRLLCYITTQLAVAARPFVFEPNDATTRAAIGGVVQSLFVNLVSLRGLYDYLVVCDSSNNTPARIDANELWVDCAIEPVKSAEFIYIPVRVVATGTLGNNTGS